MRCPMMGRTHHVPQDLGSRSLAGITTRGGSRPTDAPQAACVWHRRQTVGLQLRHHLRFLRPLHTSEAAACKPVWHLTQCLTVLAPDSGPSGCCNDRAAGVENAFGRAVFYTLAGAGHLCQALTFARRISGCGSSAGGLRVYVDLSAPRFFLYKGKPAVSRCR